MQKITYLQNKAQSKALQKIASSEKETPLLPLVALKVASGKTTKSTFDATSPNPPVRGSESGKWMWHPERRVGQPNGKKPKVAYPTVKRPGNFLRLRKRVKNYTFEVQT